MAQQLITAAFYLTMNTDNCTDDFCIAPYATQPPLPSASDYGVVGAKAAHRPSADTEYKHFVYKRFYDTGGSITAASIHREAEDKFKRNYSFSLILKLRSEMNRKNWWRYCEPDRDVLKDGYPWETT